MQAGVLGFPLSPTRRLLTRRAVHEARDLRRPRELSPVTAEKPEKSAWVGALPQHRTVADDLARLVEQDGDVAEVAYCEVAADPTSVKNDQDQRRYRGIYRRRLRHLPSRGRTRG